MNKKLTKEQKKYVKDISKGKFYLLEEDSFKHDASQTQSILMSEQFWKCREENLQEEDPKRSLEEIKSEIQALSDSTRVIEEK